MIRHFIFIILFFGLIEIGFSNSISFSKDGKDEDTINVILDEVSKDSILQVKELVFDNIDSVQSGEMVIIDSSKARIRFCKPYRFFERSAVLNKPRIGMALGLTGASYIGLNFWWSKAWYSNYEKSKFQLFNDSKEWNQVDKIGHGFSAYLESTWSAQVFEWAGMKPKKAAWLGFGVAQMWQLAIEFQDAFSAKWGFSLSDVGANIAGAGWNVWQEYAWGEQRIWLKESAWPTNYPDSLKGRANSLFGKSFAEGILKDYNSTTFWLSASIGSFIKKPDSKFPKWINVAFGYGAQNMYGGFENKWCADGGADDLIENCPPDKIIDRTDIQRIRQFYLSADIDWTRIPTKSKPLKTFFSILNIIKIPFPAVEFNTARQVKWHWLMF
jgi:hypothetical protein